MFLGRKDLVTEALGLRRSSHNSRQKATQDLFKISLKAFFLGSVLSGVALLYLELLHPLESDRSCYELQPLKRKTSALQWE